MSFENYDIPKARNSKEYDFPKEIIIEETTYDAPKPTLNTLYQAEAFSSTSETLSCSSSYHSSFTLSSDYDIPRKAFQIPHTQLLANCPRQLNINELSLDQSSLNKLNDLQSECNQSVQNLLKFVKSTCWRETQNLEPILEDLKLGNFRLKSTLQSLLDFVKYIYLNMCKAETSEIALKFKPLFMSLQKAFQNISNLSNELDWTVAVLARNDGAKTTNFDNLDKIIACTQTLTEDIRQCVSFIHGNAVLIFNNNNNTSKTGLNQNNFAYDYISFENKKKEDKKNTASKPFEESEETFNNFDGFVENIKSDVIDDDIKVKNEQKLFFYLRCVIPITNELFEAVDLFLENIERNQSPKVFSNYIKLILTSAHSQLQFASAIHNALPASILKAYILTHSNLLSSALKQGVLNTKRAIQTYPSISSVQDLVDAVVNISHMASCLKLSFLKLIKQVF